MAVGAKIAKTADRKKVMDTTKSTDCPKCGKPTRIVKRVKDRERGVPGGIYSSCSACEFFEKLEEYRVASCEFRAGVADKLCCVRLSFVRLSQSTAAVFTRITRL